MVATRTVGGRDAHAEPAGVEELRRELARTRLERDNFQQEMFESDRHAAWLAQERQRLVDAARLPDPVAADLAAQIAARDRYIGALEGVMWQAESARHRLATYVEEIESWMWARESERAGLEADRERLEAKPAAVPKLFGRRR